MSSRLRMNHVACETSDAYESCFALPQVSHLICELSCAPDMECPETMDMLGMSHILTFMWKGSDQISDLIKSNQIQESDQIRGQI